MGPTHHFVPSGQQKEGETSRYLFSSPIWDSGLTPTDEERELERRELERKQREKEKQEREAQEREQQRKQEPRRHDTEVPDGQRWADPYGIPPKDSGCNRLPIPWDVILQI